MLAEPVGRVAGVLPEHPTEIAVIAEADRVPNLFDRSVRGHQQITRAFHAYALDEFPRTFPRPRPKGPRKNRLLAGINVQRMEKKPPCAGMSAC